MLLTVGPSSRARTAGWLLAVGCALVARVPVVAAAEPVALACSPERPTVALGGRVGLRAFAGPPTGERVRYAWEVPVGRLEGEGARPRWDLTDLRPGTYAATVRATTAAGASADCVIRVMVRADPGSRGEPPRETGTAFLLPDRAERAGYGLYSYLLLGAPPTESTRDRYARAIESFLEMIPEIGRLEAHVPRQSLNVAYLPVDQEPGAPPVASSWVLAHYDHARARSLLRLLPGPLRGGPYIVSTLAPLSQEGSVEGPRLFQDLSRVPSHLVSTWVTEFLNQAAQERFWEERSGRALALRMRLTVGILGTGLPEVRKAVDDWVAWLPAPGK
jgi:hypothetical protein